MVVLCNTVILQWEATLHYYNVYFDVSARCTYMYIKPAVCSGGDGGGDDGLSANQKMLCVVCCRDGVCLVLLEPV